MRSINYNRSSGDEYITEEIETNNQKAKSEGHMPFRHLKISLSGVEIVNDGTDTETATISVVDGLEVARGIKPNNATVLNYDGDVTLTIDGAKTTKTLSNGTVSFDLTTDKPAGSTITVTAEFLADHPAESDSAVIEVVSK